MNLGDHFAERAASTTINATTSSSSSGVHCPNCSGHREVLLGDCGGQGGGRGYDCSVGGQGEEGLLDHGAGRSSCRLVDDVGRRGEP